MAVVNLLKLALLLVGYIGYLTTGTQQASIGSDLTTVQHRDKRSIYLNAKAPILIGIKIYAKIEAFGLKCSVSLIDNKITFVAAYITIPISVALPAMKGRSARSQNQYNGTQVPYSYDDPLFAAQLQKIDLYMNYLEV